MESKAELRVPTIAVPVTLAVVGGEVFEAELFLADSTRHGRSKLLDELATQLDADDAFIAVRRADVVRLVPKHCLAWIVMRRRDDSDEDFDDSPSDVVTLYDRQHRVELELVGGKRFSGSLFDSSPSVRPRLIDHLNGARRFVRLWTPVTQTLINAQQIAWVSEQE